MCCGVSPPVRGRQCRRCIHVPARRGRRVLQPDTASLGGRPGASHPLAARGTVAHAGVRRHLVHHHRPCGACVARESTRPAQVRTRRIHVFGGRACLPTLGRARCWRCRITTPMTISGCRPPYHDRREVPERLRLMHAMFVGLPWCSAARWTAGAIRHPVASTTWCSCMCHRIYARRGCGSVRRGARGAAVAPGGWRPSPRRSSGRRTTTTAREGRSPPRHRLDAADVGFCSDPAEAGRYTGGGCSRGPMRRDGDLSAT